MLCGESGFESGLEFGSMTVERDSSQGGKVPATGCGWEKIYEQWLDPPCYFHASTSHSLGFGPVMGPMDPRGKNSWCETTLNHIVKVIPLLIFINPSVAAEEKASVLC